MKCVSLIGKVKSMICILRMSNERADQLVADGDAHYVSKSVWKKYGRKFDKISYKQANESFIALKRMENKNNVEK